LAFALHSAPGPIRLAPSLAVVLVGAVTWAALLAVLWLPSIAASVLVGLCLGAIQQATHKRPKHAPRVLAEFDYVDPALHVHVNRPRCRSQSATPNPSSALSDLRKRGLSGAQGGGLMW